MNITKVFLIINFIVFDLNNICKLKSFGFSFRMVRVSLNYLSSSKVYIIVAFKVFIDIEKGWSTALIMFVKLSDDQLILEL